MKIRIGNDFKTKWAITWLGEPEDFSDATDMSLSFNIYDKKIELTKDVDYTITDNIIEIDVTPDICNILGVYNLELHYTKPNDDFIDGERRSAVDIDAFRIVGKSEKADATQDVSIISDAVAIFLDIAYKKLEEIEANEVVRVENEEERVANEVTRVSNEADRQTNTTTAISNAEQATLNANNSAVYANEKGAYAEEMSSHPPTIINDYWHIWDFTTNQYETTGQYARGDSAIDGALVVQEKGQSAVNTMSQKAITDDLELKANHGYTSNPKTLKQVDDEIVQLATHTDSLRQTAFENYEFSILQKDFTFLGGDTKLFATVAIKAGSAISIKCLTDPLKHFIIQGVSASSGTTFPIFDSGTTHGDVVEADIVLSSDISAIRFYPYASTGAGSASLIIKIANEYAKHGYSTTPKTLKQVDDSKAESGGSPKTLKEVDDEKADHGYESIEVAKTLKEVEEQVLSTIKRTKIDYISNARPPEMIDGETYLNTFYKKIYKLIKSISTEVELIPKTIYTFRGASMYFNGVDFIPIISGASEVKLNNIVYKYSSGTLTETTGTIDNLGAKIAVSKGDILVLHKDATITTEPMFIYTNKSSTETYRMELSAKNTPYVLYCDMDGIVYINVRRIDKTPLIQKSVSKITAESVFNKLDKELRGEVGLEYGIVKSANIGESITFEVDYSTSNASHKIIDVNEGEIVTFSGKGLNDYRLYCITDKNGIVIDVSAPYAYEDNVSMVMPKNASKFILNAYNIWEAVEGYTRFLIAPLKRLSNVDKGIDKLGEGLVPMGSFDKDSTFHDFTDVMANINFTNYSSFLSDILTGYDTLVSEHPDFVTKADLSELLDIPYPEYANGTNGHPDYLTTPSYKVPVYKFSNSNDAIHVGKTNKKKIFIITGTHGAEKASIVTAYLFLRRMCKESSSDINLFTLRNTFDIHIIPCLSGWSVIHNTRTNANKVDLNRNYPIDGWRVVGNIGDATYSGATAGSEFETKIVTAYVDLIKPDFPIDFHNFGELKKQTYLGSYHWEITMPTFQAYNNASFYALKNMPEHFGTKYFILTDLKISPSIKFYIYEGTFANWAQGIYGSKFGCTFEVSNGINFSNGVYIEGSKPIGQSSPELYKLNEAIFREFLYRGAEAILKFPSNVFVTRN